LKAVIGAEYLLNLLPQGTHDYRKFITPSELTRMARNAGLIPVAMTGLTYNPLTKKYRLCDDISVNYMMAFKKV
jgi:2-polyprenyl-6-hydroxyphenyl methylase/3-demethylubiquinone-9 3-methyltransferase